MIAVAANTEGRREIIGMGVGPSEAETFWIDLLRSRKARGLDGVKLVINGAHTGLKGAITRVFEASWPRCRVHWMRNALAHVSKSQHTGRGRGDPAGFRSARPQARRRNLAPRRGAGPHSLAEARRPQEASEHDVLA